MGGSCDYYPTLAQSSYTPPRVVRSRKPANPQWQQEMRTFARTHSLDNLLCAGKFFFRTRSKGFIGKLSEACGIKKLADIPKEFPEIEYEVKFDIQPTGRGEEPSVIQYLDAFDFPIGATTRFIKDPAHNFAVGTNHFIGDSEDERVVVIEKCGNSYLKEKGLVVPVRLGIPYEQIVVKRTEERHAADMAEILRRTKKATEEPGVEYRGKIRKEKGDDFLLDTNDGRLYSFTVTRAHLTKPGENKESGVQRQLEIEYAGYIPGFKGFERDSERQVVQGMIDLAKYTFGMYNGAPIGNGWRMNLALTSQRKYDFVLGRAENPSLKGRPLELMASSNLLVANVK